MNDIQTVVQILAKLLVGKFRVKVSLGGRDDSYIDCVGSKNRRSAACIGKLISPTSSRNTVPPCVCWRHPLRALKDAPAQLIAMNGASRRRPCWWMSLATTSFPTPLSPVMRTLASDRAAHSSSCWISCMAADDPMSRCREDIFECWKCERARTLAPYSPDVNTWTHGVRASVYL